MDELRKRLEARLRGFQEAQALLAKIRGWRTPGDILANAKVIFELVTLLVVQVEGAAKDLSGVVDGLRGEDKQVALAEWLDSMIPLPFWLEWADGPLIKFAINLAVSQLNDRFGHDWEAASEPTQFHRAAVEEITGLPYEPRPVTAKLPEADVTAALDAMREGREVPGDVRERILGTSVPEPAPTSQVAAKTKAAAASKSRWDTCLSVVLGFEGGYSNNPNDKGGATNLGITAGTLARAHKAGIVGHNDVKRLTRAEAAAIYRRFYWDPIGGDRLPAPLDMVLFDAAVNCGVGAAVKQLQEALNALLPGNPLVVDGGYGPKTLEALNSVLDADQGITQLYRGLEPHALLRYLALDALVNKIELYDALADKSPSQRTFLRGWIHNRAVALATKAGMEG